MPTFYNFRQNGLDYSFDNIFVPADLFREGNLWIWGQANNGRLGNATTTGNVSTPITTFTGGSNWKQIVGGESSVLAIKTDGTLWTWGSGSTGRLGNGATTGTVSTPITTFAGGTNWKQVAMNSGGSLTSAIKTDGTLWTWGVQTNGSLGNGATTGTVSTPITTFAGGTNWKEVACGSNFTAAIKTDGTLWTWGGNGSGQLGNNSSVTNSSTPVTTFAGGNNWKQVSSSISSVLAIKTDGTLWSWGSNSTNQLGTNDTIQRSTPVTTFAGGTNWKLSFGGRFHVGAIKTDGTLWTWGSNTYGQLGKGLVMGSSRFTPITTFAGGTNWADTSTTEPEDLYTLSGGNNHTAAIKTDGTLWVWGNQYGGKLGNTITVTTNVSTPITTFAGGTNWKQVSCGLNHTAAIKTDGTLWTWGRNNGGQLGNATTSLSSTPVTTFAGGTNWKQVSVFSNDTAAIKTDGTLWTWGYSAHGKLGNATITPNVSTPVTTFAGGNNWKHVSVGADHKLAIKTDGTLWIWGRAQNGQLGNATTSLSSTPVTTFAGGTNWKQAKCGSTHTTAIKTDGTLWTWGRNADGQLGNGEITDKSTPITTFSGGTNWKQVSCGTLHTSAIKTDGTLWTWGSGSTGRLGILSDGTISTPVTTFAGGTNWKQVDSTNHTVALNGNELFLFGPNNEGQLGIPVFDIDAVPATTFAGGTNWKQASANRGNTSAVKTDGTLWIWGASSAGQLGNGQVTNNINTPVTTFAGGTNWRQVSSPDFGAIALTYEDPVI